MIPVEHRCEIHPAAVAGDGLRPFGSIDEEAFVLPVYVPVQRMLETNWHMIVETMQRKPVRIALVDEGHASVPTLESLVETPAKGE